MHNDLRDSAREHDNESLNASIFPSRMCLKLDEVFFIKMVSQVYLEWNKKKKTHPPAQSALWTPWKHRRGNDRDRRLWKKQLGNQTYHCDV